MIGNVLVLTPYVIAEKGIKYEEISTRGRVEANVVGIDLCKLICECAESKSRTLILFPYSFRI